MKHKPVVIVMVVSMLWLCAFPALAAEGDQPSNWAQAEVAEAIQNGLVPEDLQSNYQAPITRGEFAKLLVQTVFAKVKKEHTNQISGMVRGAFWTKEEFLENVTVDAQFEDTTEDDIRIAYALGSINGVTDTKFAPNNLITRQEAATMLANTIHMSVGFAYETKEQLGYEDYDRIADWAKPGVQVSSIMGLMLGIGKNFDYLGEFTREQSIATMVRFYHIVRYSDITLKGIIYVSARYDEFTYHVGRDYVYVTYTPNENSKYHASFAGDMYNAWYSSPKTGSLSNYTLEGTAEFAAFAPIVPDMEEIAQTANDNKPIKIDLGYMTYETKHNGHLAEFKFKDVPGYACYIGGYVYGFPEQIPVVAKVMK